jgi:hypothetical protein
MKRKPGNKVIIALVVLNLIVWLVFPPVNDGVQNLGVPDAQVHYEEFNFAVRRMQLFLLIAI